MEMDGQGDWAKLDGITKQGWQIRHYFSRPVMCVYLLELLLYINLKYGYSAIFYGKWQEKLVGVRQYWQLTSRTQARNFLIVLVKILDIALPLENSFPSFLIKT